MVVSIPFMTSTSASPVITALPTANIFMNPFRIQGTAGSTVTVNLKVSNIVNLFAFQAGATFDPAVVNITANHVIEGGFLSNNGADTLLAFPGTVNNTAGIVNIYGWTLVNPLLAKNGSGTLMSLDFYMKTTGYSDIHIVGFIGTDNTAVTNIPVNTEDFSTVVVGGTQYIVEIVGNPYGAVPPVNGGFSGHNFAVIEKTIGADTYHGEFNFTTTSIVEQGGDFAYFNVTIPKLLMNCSDTPALWRLSLDDVLQGSRTVTENATHTTLSLEFTYNSLPQKITIDSINAVPEFPMVFLATLLVLATFAAAILGKSTLKPKRKS